MTARDEKEKEKFCRENLSTFFYDMAKANFTTNVAGCFFAMFFQNKYNDGLVWLLLLIGLIITTGLAYMGYRISKR